MSTPTFWRCRRCGQVVCAQHPGAACRHCGALDGFDVPGTVPARWRVGHPGYNEGASSIFEVSETGRWELVGYFITPERALAAVADHEQLPELRGKAEGYEAARDNAQRFREELCAELGLNDSPGDIELIAAARRCIRFARGVMGTGPGTPGSVAS